MKLFTIGFTRKSASGFFETLRESRVRQVVDVRLNNVSQLAGFSKRDDLSYFLREIGGIAYFHRLDLAPTQDMLDQYRKHGGDWKTYEEAFSRLMQDRHVESSVPREILADGCLLCSEEMPHHCHRRIVAEYFKACWGDVDIVHL